MSKKVLVVDDQPGIRLLLKDVLTHEGYKVQTATTGQEALDLVQNGAFDLMILDYKLPIMDGKKVVEKLEKLNSRIPIFLVTGLGEIEKEIKKCKLVKKVVSKPFNIQEICDEVKAILA